MTHMWQVGRWCVGGLLEYFLRVSGVEVFPRELRGHYICTHESGYAYCTVPFARRSRDTHFTHVADCKKATQQWLTIGAYACKRDHIVRLNMAKWKVAAYRPRFTCQLRRQPWATAEYKHSCRHPRTE